MLRLLNFFGPRAMLQLFQISTRVFHRSLRLIVGSAELLVLQANEHLTFFYPVTFFYADPCQAAGDLRIYVNRVMGHDITRGRKHRPAHIVAAGLRRRPHHLDLGNVSRSNAIGESDQSKQDNDRNAADDVATRPDRRLPGGFSALRSIDPQALQILMLRIKRHNLYYASALP